MFFIFAESAKMRGLISEFALNFLAIVSKINNAGAVRQQADGLKIRISKPLIRH